MTRIDIVSVDDVARATMLLAVKPTLAHDLYHVSAGDEAPQVAQIVRAMDEAAGMTGAPRYAACAPAELPLVVRDVLGRTDPALERVIGRALQRCGNSRRSIACSTTAACATKSISSRCRSSITSRNDAHVARRGRDRADPRHGALITAPHRRPFPRLAGTGAVLPPSR